MKISIGSKIIKGPWGGGNLFAINISKFLEELGHDVIYNLHHKDIDIILLTDPRGRGESSSTFNDKDILNYKNFVNPNVSVIQRINECDQRKGTNNINDLYLNASKVADHVIFVSSWLRDIYLDLGLPHEKTSVILAGADKLVFNSTGYKVWNKSEKFKFVTHHWSSHINKGFKEYEMLDRLLEHQYWKNLIEFTYIGNLPLNFEFKNAKVVPPLSGKDLANELRKNHGYITASSNEPSGNHHIEAAQCGLPILYKSSGGIPEYCSGYGEELNNNFEESIKKFIDNYYIHQKNMTNYPFDSKIMCKEFLDIFNLYQDNNQSIQDIRINKIFKEYYLLKNYLITKFWEITFFSKITNIIVSKIRKKSND